MENWKQKENKARAIIAQTLVPILIYYVINNAAVICGLSVVQVLGSEATFAGVSESVWFYTENIIKMTAMALGGLAVYPYFKKENLDNDGKPILAKDGFMLIMAGIVLSVGINYLFSITGFMQSNEKYQQVAETQFALPLWLAYIFYGMLSPIVEETVFRGIVYNSLCRNVGNNVAILGSALLFGAFHGNMVQMIYASLMGIFMAYLYQKHQNLLAPILFHGAANAAVYTLTYFF